MKRYTFETLLAIVLLVPLKPFLLNPAFATPDCNLICEGSYVIDDIDTTADLEALSGCISVTGDLSIRAHMLFAFPEDHDLLTRLQPCDAGKGSMLLRCINGDGPVFNDPIDSRTDA